MNDVRQAIERAVQQFSDAFRRGDAAAVASLYTEDAKLMPPNHPKVQGTEAIRQFWQGAMDTGVKEARIEIEDVEAQGDTAYEVGRYTLTIEQGNGERASDVGKYVVVWKRGGGGWRLYVDIFNSDTPAPQPYVMTAHSGRKKRTGAAALGASRLFYVRHCPHPSNGRGVRFTNASDAADDSRKALIVQPREVWAGKRVQLPRLLR